jgi:hypothetical protein
MFYLYLETNSNFCPIQHKLIGSYNRGEKFYLHGAKLVFKLSILHFVFLKVYYFSTFTFVFLHIEKF